jgi:hypothetical protein
MVQGMNIVQSCDDSDRVRAPHVQPSTTTCEKSLCEMSPSPSVSTRRKRSAYERSAGNFASWLSRALCSPFSGSRSISSPCSIRCILSCFLIAACTSVAASTEEIWDTCDSRSTSTPQTHGGGKRVSTNTYSYVQVTRETLAITVVAETEECR